MGFKSDNPFDKRLQISTRLLEQYSDKIPCIVESHNEVNAVQIQQTKYLIGKECTVGTFLLEIRKNNIEKLQKTEALFLFCNYKNNGVLAPISNTIEQVYEKYRDDDGFLYFTVAKEQTFGM